MGPAGRRHNLRDSLVIKLAILKQVDIFDGNLQLCDVLLCALLAWLGKRPQLRLHSDWQIVETADLIDIVIVELGHFELVLLSLLLLLLILA